MRVVVVLVLITELQQEQAVLAVVAMGQTPQTERLVQQTLVVAAAVVLISHLVQAQQAVQAS
jgi:hypothetical protein